MAFIFTKKLFSLVCIVFFTALLSGCGFKDNASETYKVKLEVWDVFDDSDMYTDIFAEYKKINPYVSNIVYRKLSPETYKEDLLNALAAGNGPDIFMIRSAWRSSFEDKIVPAPEYFFTEKQYREALVDVAGSDFIKEGKIYGVPLSVDSLGLYYNKDLFNAAGIVSPPLTWEELLEDVKKLNRLDAFGNFTQSAIALGTAYNINRSTDILTALTLQMGSSANQSGNISNDSSRRALEFYTQFSRINSSVYSWNPRSHYSIDAFYEGTLGMMINYSWHTATIKQKNAKMNFGVAPLPQFANTAPVNFANYGGFVVAKNKVVADIPSSTETNTPPVDAGKRNMLRVHEAWQLLSYMALPHPANTITLKNGITGMTKDFTLTSDPTKKYLEKTLRPAARRDLIEWQKNDILLAPFALGNLIAKNVYQGNPEGVETVLAEMIDVVNKGEKSISDALNTANARINTLGR